MKAFKTFIASAIAGVMVLSMATSAFAANTVTVNSVDTDSKVSATIADSYAGGGERTVLVVTQDSWAEASGLVANPEIVYINQVADSALEATLGEMAGLNLDDGDYVVLVGNKNGTVDSGNFTAIKVTRLADGGAVGDATAVYWDVKMNRALLSESLSENNLFAKFYDNAGTFIEDSATALSAGEGFDITGDGDFTFTVETTVSTQHVGDTQLEISAGTVSHKN